MELGFELADCVTNIKGDWPYQKGVMATDIRVASFLHHIPGVDLLLPLLMNDLHFNPHLQAIGGWLLFAGGVSCICGFFVYTRDFTNPMQMKEAALVQLFGFGFFVYARWIVFPVEVIALSNEVRENSKDFGENFLTLVNVMGWTMAVFNLAVALTVGPKTVRYLLRAFLTNRVSLDPADKEEMEKKAAEGKIQ